jgi:hypothetical protein
MNDTPQLDHQELIRRISRDLADGYDEELEMEIEDRPPIRVCPPRRMRRLKKPIVCATSMIYFDFRQSW